MAKNKKEVTSELEKKLCGMIKAIINETFEENERRQKEKEKDCGKSNG